MLTLTARRIIMLHMPVCCRDSYSLKGSIKVFYKVSIRVLRRIL